MGCTGTLKQISNSLQNSKQTDGLVAIDTFLMLVNPMPHKTVSVPGSMSAFLLFPHGWDNSLIYDMSTKLRTKVH